MNEIGYILANESFFNVLTALPYMFDRPSFYSQTNIIDRMYMYIMDTNV